MTDKMHYANPDETTFTGAHYVFCFGAHGDTKVTVIQRPDHLDDALEIAAEWLKEHAPGLFSEPDYDGARAERGCDCKQTDDLHCCIACGEAAETDHTYTEAGWLLSWEWTVDEHEGEPFDAPWFDRFDICQAHASFWSVWHGGQSSMGYVNLCRAMALVSDTMPFDHLSENAQAIYRKLALSDGR